MCVCVCVCVCVAGGGGGGAMMFITDRISLLVGGQVLLDFASF